MRSSVLSALHEWPAGGGVTGASKVALYSPSAGKPFLAKWKVVPTGLDSWNNSPRREIAAYEVQKLFLDPDDFVVPPSVIRCAPLDEYRALITRSARPTIPGSDCVLGNLSLWLENVKGPNPLYDEKRFAEDPNYAYHIANFNLLTYLIDHKDGRRANFLVSNDESDRRVFAIDNGISFDAWIWNYFVPNWNDLRVPALSKKAIDRLRTVTSDDIESLLVLSELLLQPDGTFESVSHGAPISRRKGARRHRDVVQFGLTEEEVDDLAENIRDIIERVDAGEMPVF